MAHHLAVKSRNPVLVHCRGRNLQGRKSLTNSRLVQHRSVQVDKGKHSAQTRLDFEMVAVYSKVVCGGKPA